jgi:hypothetical protein
MGHNLLFLTPHFKSETTPAFLPFRAADFRGDFDPTLWLLPGVLVERVVNKSVRKNAGPTVLWGGYPRGV